MVLSAALPVLIELPLALLFGAATLAVIARSFPLPSLLALLLLQRPPLLVGQAALFLDLPPLLAHLPLLLFELALLGHGSALLFGALSL